MVENEFDFSGAIIGKDFFGRDVFSFDKMVNILVYTYGYDRAEAVEFIEYRLDCELHEANGPVIVYIN